jgi:uncharacterized protein
MDLTVAQQVMELYTQIDQKIAAFQQATQLHCPPGCGACCENPQVEVTPLELLPLAIELFQRGEATDWLERVSTELLPDVCVFYKPDPLIPGNGRCQVYPWRPTLCRLFGFATVRNRLSQPELAACVRHKATQPDQVAQAQAAIAQGLPAPNFAELSQQVANLDPYWGTQPMPINQALRVALERVGISYQYQDE